MTDSGSVGVGDFCQTCGLAVGHQAACPESEMRARIAALSAVLREARDWICHSAPMAWCANGADPRWVGDAAEHERRSEALLVQIDAALGVP